MAEYSRSEISDTIRLAYEQYVASRQAYEKDSSEDNLVELVEARDVMNYWINKADELGFYPFPTPLVSPQTLSTPTEQRTPTLFISHTREDKPFVERLIKDLQTAHRAVWIDTSIIKSDEIWSQAVGAGINNSYASITVVSRAANTNKWVEREYQWADQMDTKPMLVLQIEDCELPNYLNNRQVTAFFPDYQTGLSNLLAALPTPPDAPPVGRRELELEYLETLRLEEWLKTIRQTEQYTPLAGHVQGGRANRATELMPIRYRHMRFILRDKRMADKPADEGSQTDTDKPREYTNILTAIREIRRAALLGEPGAGKTTTLWRLAKEMVETARRDPKAPLPILLRLGKWTDGDQALRAFIQQELGALGAHLETLLGEKRAALLLDGLNEIPVAQRRAGKDEQVQALFESYPDLTSVVSCRERDYTLDLGFDRIEITPLDPVRIREFVTRYLGPERGEALFWRLAGGEEIRRLWEIWRGAGATLDLFFDAPDVPRENPNVYGSTIGSEDTLWQEKVRKNKGSLMTLARNPYLLMMMTDLFQEQGTLPNNQGELFTQFINELIEREGEKMSGREAELLQALAKIAYTMQTRREQVAAGAEGDEESAATSLPLKEARPGLISDELLYLAGSASLLNLSGDSLRFSHQLLQEYFAATYMLTEIRAGRLKAETLWPRDRWWERTGWEEAAVLLAGLHSADCTRILEWAGDANPEVAAACITRSGAAVPEPTLKRLQERWIPRLTDIQRDPLPQARAAVGRALGLTRLDNRPGVLEFNWGEDYWCRVPAGEYSYQGKPDKINYDFWIGKYQITWAQWKLFLEAKDGYQNPEWWKDLHADGIKQQQGGAGDQYFKFDSHPAEGVSWYEAVAFCRWLNTQPLTLPSSLSLKGRGRGEAERLEISPVLEARMQQVARDFRKSPTPSEALLWDHLRDHQLAGRKFRRQHPVGPFILDFYCAAERLAVEVDGRIHETQREADAARQTLLESLGIRFVRIPADALEQNLPTALAAIRAAFLPSPLEGEGQGVRGSYQIRLPLETEWEKAASWDAKVKKAREYPWVDGYQVGYANINETFNKVGPHYLQTTTAVGIYPQGVSPCGALDMSGNVWEWCLNEYNSGQVNIGSNKPRVLPGGSWFDDRDDARAASRVHRGPDDRGDNLGFRVVVAPVSL